MDQAAWDRRHFSSRSPSAELRAVRELGSSVRGPPRQLGQMRGDVERRDETRDSGPSMRAGPSCRGGRCTTRCARSGVAGPWSSLHSVQLAGLHAARSELLGQTAARPAKSVCGVTDTWTKDSRVPEDLILEPDLSGRADSNCRPHRPERCALPNCATPRNHRCFEGSRRPDPRGVGPRRMVRSVPSVKVATTSRGAFRKRLSKPPEHRSVCRQGATRPPPSSCEGAGFACAASACCTNRRSGRHCSRKWLQPRAFSAETNSGTAVKRSATKP